MKNKVAAVHETGIFSAQQLVQKLLFLSIFAVLVVWLFVGSHPSPVSCTTNGATMAPLVEYIFLEV